MVNTILTDDERREIHRKAALAPSPVDTLIEETEAAVLAKLAAQEPTLWQVRLRCKGNKHQAWSSWSECNESSAKAYQASTDAQWQYETRALYLHPSTQTSNGDRVTEFNVGRWCMSEGDCIAEGIDFSAYERGVADAANAFGKNAAAATEAPAQAIPPQWREAMKVAREALVEARTFTGAWPAGAAALAQLDALGGGE